MEGMKFDDNKLQYSLIPVEATKALAEVLTFGAKKYAPDNWKKIEPRRYIDALYRHLEAWRSGELNDKESGLSHLKHAITNIAFLLYFENEKTPLPNVVGGCNFKEQPFDDFTTQIQCDELENKFYEDVNPEEIMTPADWAKYLEGGD